MCCSPLSPRLLLNATRQSGKSTVAALKAAWTVLQGGLAVVVSPSLRQSGFLFRKLARHLVASEAAFRRETMTEVELVSGGLAVSLPGDRPAMLRGLSLRHDGPAVLIVDEASRVRDELWATISPMLAAAPAAQQILLSTPAGASGEFHRAWSSDEDWERVQITADQCPRISAAHLAAERIRLGDALYRQEYFGAFVSAPGSVFDAEVLAHMFGDHTEEEPEEPLSIVEGTDCRSLLAMNSVAYVRRLVQHQIEHALCMAVEEERRRRDLVDPARALGSDLPIWRKPR